MPLSELRTVPQAVTEAAEALDGLDDALVVGFGRLGAAHLEAIASLARSFAATPMAAGLAEAAQGLGRSEFIDRHFLLLAAARSAVQGAMHDALLAQACAALGRPLPELDGSAAAPAQDPPPQAEVLLESVRQWLMELAIAGFANLSVDHLLPFQATLDAIEAEPGLVRHAALLSGFLGEMLSVFPSQGAVELPRLRWADLWSRAMVLAASAKVTAGTRSVSGEVRPLGTELRQHSNVANLVVYASLRETGAAAPRLVRIHVTAFKVDVIQGDELGALLGEASGKLIAALSGGLRLEVQDLQLCATGDLLWDDARVRLREKGDAMAEAAAVLSPAPALRPCLQPADRHPALIDELLYLPARECEAGLPLDLDAERMADSADLRLADLAGARGLLALLRFDGGAWSLQPIAVDRGKGVTRMAGTGLLDGQKKAGKGSTLATLKERAGKLLRKKS